MKKNKPQLLIQNNLNPAQAKILNALNKNNTLNYSKLIDKIFKTTNKKKKWIITPILSRDFAQSELFSDLNFLLLLEFLVKRNKVDRVEVKNKLLKEVIKKRFPKLKVKLQKLKYIKKISFQYITIFMNFLRLIIYSFLMIISKSHKRKEFFKNKKIILIETFLSKSLIKNNRFIERYNKEAFLKFPTNLKKDSYFYPVNLSLQTIQKSIKILRNEKIKFIHPLDFLNLKDYIDSIFLIPSLGKIHRSKIIFNNFEISNIVKEYNFFSYFNFSTYLSNLNYNFLKRLRENDIKIKFILDWYENQIIDKGFCMGKNEYYQSIKIKGHMGFINDFRNIHYYRPTHLENKLKCIPDEILVINKNILNKFKKDKITKYKIVPSSRNQTLFNIKLPKKTNFNKKINILFILSTNQRESNFIFTLILNLIPEINLKKFNIIIKAHPNTKISKIINKDKNIIISNNLIYDEMLNAEIIISGGTTATIEAQILEKKIILVGNNSGIMLNPLMKNNQKLLKVCYNSKDLMKHIFNFSKTKQKRNNLNNNLLNYYFVKTKKRLNKNFYN